MSFVVIQIVTSPEVLSHLRKKLPHLNEIHLFQNKTNIFLISFLDKEPPKITCPKDMEVIKTGPGHTTVVHWHPPTADDNSGGHVVLFTESVAGSGFTVGRHRITYKATDPSGNKASCTFTITVLSE